jgi:hypothetical protein
LPLRENAKPLRAQEEAEGAEPNTSGISLWWNLIHLHQVWPGKDSRSASA